MSASAKPARTPEPPYHAVIFTSTRTDADRGYGAVADRMVELATRQPGFLGVESVRDPATGLGITVSYWTGEDAIRAWREDAEHRVAQETGKAVWYSDYQMRIAKVERAYGKAA